MGWHSLCLPQELEVRWRVSTFHPGGCKQVKPSLPVCMDSFQPESTTGRKAGSASTEASQTERMGSTAWRDHRRTRGQIADPLLSILQTLIGIFRWLPSALLSTISHSPIPWNQGRLREPLSSSPVKPGARYCSCSSHLAPLVSPGPTPHITCVPASTTSPPHSFLLESNLGRSQAEYLHG